jgi:hypothetical protein
LTTWVARRFTKGVEVGVEVGVEELGVEFKVFIRISEAANKGAVEVHITKGIIKSQPLRYPVIMDILGAIG